jgi:hypothetical protein
MTQWIPNKANDGRHAIGWHITQMHVKANENGAKGFALNGRNSAELEAEHQRMHSEESFETGKEHKHWTPKK